MVDDLIIEAAARALQKATYTFFDDDEGARWLATVMLTAVTPLIRAQALEEAALIVDDDDGVFSYAGEHRNVIMLQEQSRGLAAAIRALKEQP